MEKSKMQEALEMAEKGVRNAVNTIYYQGTEAEYASKQYEKLLNLLKEIEEMKEQAETS